MYLGMGPFHFGVLVVEEFKLWQPNNLTLWNILKSATMLSFPHAAYIYALSFLSDKIV